jgi:5-methylcytosine-specific restriction protein A
LRPSRSTVQGYTGWSLRFESQAEDGFDFDILLSASHHRAEATFRPSRFSGPLIRQMTSGLLADRALWDSELDRAQKAGVEVVVSVDGDPRPDQEDFPPLNMRDLEIECVCRIPGHGGDVPKAVEQAAMACLGLVLACLEFVSSSDDGDLIFEGRLLTRTQTKYERSPLARLRCIMANGTKCRVCGLDFGEAYGDIGAGFIEVHHLESLSSIGHEHAVNPVTDLVPLCSNCHSMAHTSRPPVTPEELGLRLADGRLGLAVPGEQLGKADPVLTTQSSVHQIGKREEDEGSRILRLDLFTLSAKLGPGTLFVFARDSEGRETSCEISVDEIGSAIDLASAGLGSNVEVDTTTGRVDVQEGLVVLSLGSLALQGKQDEWESLLGSPAIDREMAEDRLGSSAALVFDAVGKAALTTASGPSDALP